MSDFTARDAELALDIASSLVERLFDERWLRRTDFHLMISRLGGEFGYVLLAEKSFGSVADCEQKYKPIAQAKTRISARTRLSSREVQCMRPDLLNDADTLYWGSAIQGDIIVAGKWCAGIRRRGDRQVHTGHLHGADRSAVCCPSASR